jgi:hypothetical protein
MGWDGRSRINGSWGMDRQGTRRGPGKRIPFSDGQARFGPERSMSEQGESPVHLALGRPPGSQAAWLGRRDDPTATKACEACGRRCASDEPGLDAPSHGVQLASSLIRSATALERRCGILASTPLQRVAHGTAVGPQGQRRWGDAPGLQGQSDLKMGWRGGKLARSRGDALTASVRLSAETDPAPASASNIPPPNHAPLCLALEFQEAVA